LTAALTGLLGLAGTHEAWSLVLYTASNEQLEKIVIDAFREAHPDIKVESVNMSTGPITQRLIAEKENPKADVVWMINDIALKKLKDEGVLEPYEPKGLAIDSRFVIRTVSIWGMMPPLWRWRSILQCSSSATCPSRMIGLIS